MGFVYQSLGVVSLQPSAWMSSFALLQKYWKSAVETKSNTSSGDIEEKGLCASSSSSLVCESMSGGNS